jgi:hypothetical protein
MNLHVHRINGELFLIIDLAGFYLDLQKNKHTGPVVSRVGQIFAGRPFAIHGATKKEKKEKEKKKCLAGGAAVSERKNGDGGSPRAAWRRR